MALISCPECGHLVSDKALRCPQCKKQLVIGQVPTEEEIVCQECGISFSKSFAECPNCGCPVNSIGEQTSSNIHSQKHKRKEAFRIAIPLFVVVVFFVLVFIRPFAKLEEVEQGIDPTTPEPLSSHSSVTERNTFNDSVLEFKFLDLSMFSKVWERGIYKCGIDIDPGEYYLLTIYSGTSIWDVSNSSDNFPYVGNGVIYKINIQENQYIEVPHSMILASSTEVESRTWNELGVFLVGTDLPAGEYKIETLTNEYHGNGIITTNICAGYHIFHNQPGVNPVSGNFVRDAQKYITVEDGQYLALRNARLILIEKAATKHSATTSIDEINEAPENTFEETKKQESNTQIHSKDKSNQYSTLCEADGCSKMGIYPVEGFSGKMEYYCYTHYSEIQSMMSDMLKTTRPCEKDGCTKEGTYAIENFIGGTEYYCYSHYNDIQEMLNSLYNEPNYGGCDNCGRPAKYKWDEKTVYCESCFESLVNYIFKN